MHVHKHIHPPSTHTHTHTHFFFRDNLHWPACGLYSSYCRTRSLITLAISQVMIQLDFLYFFSSSLSASCTQTGKTVLKITAYILHQLQSTVKYSTVKLTHPTEKQTTTVAGFGLKVSKFVCLVVFFTWMVSQIYEFSLVVPITLFDEVRNRLTPLFTIDRDTDWHMSCGEEARHILH